MDNLLRKWKARSEASSRFVFPNLNSKQKLSSSAISSTTKKVLKEAGIVEVSHHGIRRGAANFLQGEGLSREEIQNRGRWRSGNGLARYLQDNARAQGVIFLCFLSFVDSFCWSCKDCKRRLILSPVLFQAIKTTSSSNPTSSPPPVTSSSSW